MRLHLASYRTMLCCLLAAGVVACNSGAPTADPSASGAANTPPTVPPGAAIQNTFEPLPAAEVTAIQPAAIRAALEPPTPDEIFAGMAILSASRAGGVPWATYAQPDTGALPTANHRAAFHLGRRIANFYMAVRAQQTQAATTLAEQIVAGAQQLGVGSQANDALPALRTAISSQDWDSVRVAMQRMTEAAKEELSGEGRDAVIPNLIALGSWARGMQVVSTLVGEQYTEDTASLLRQGDVATYFAQTIDTIGAPDPALTQARGLLGQLAQVMNIPHTAVHPPAGVQQIRDLSNTLLNTL